MAYELSITLLTLAAVAVMIAQRRLVRGTTLIAPWWWTVAALTLVAVTEVVARLAELPPASSRAWQFLSASATLCPGIALLGAKRPQDRAWSWIVASLWLILALPAIQQLVMNRSTEFEIHRARIWFMAGMMAFCAANSLFSRYWYAVLLAAFGQVMVFLPFFLSQRSIPENIKWGIAPLYLAVILAPIRFRNTAVVNPMDQVWMDFRNQFGLVWSLRFMESFNTTSSANDWNLVLIWSGFRNRDGESSWELPPEQLRVVRQTLSNLLRRFVSTEWITSRLPDGGPIQSEPAAAKQRP